LNDVNTLADREGERNKQGGVDLKNPIPPSLIVCDWPTEGRVNNRPAFSQKRREMTWRLKYTLFVYFLSNILLSKNEFFF
jgi:hypothetical protein